MPTHTPHLVFQQSIMNNYFTKSITKLFFICIFGYNEIGINNL